LPVEEQLMFDWLGNEQVNAGGSVTLTVHAWVQAFASVTVTV
jgi:hypothetical protein